MRRFMLTLMLAGLIGMELILAHGVFVVWGVDVGVSKEFVLKELPGGAMTVQVVKHPFTAWDWFLFTAFIAVVIAANVALVYMFWRDWHSSRTRS